MLLDYIFLLKQYKKLKSWTEKLISKKLQISSKWNAANAIAEIKVICSYGIFDTPTPQFHYKILENKLFKQ